MKKLDAFDWLIIAGCAWGCLSVVLKAIWNKCFAIKYLKKNKYGTILVESEK